MEADDDPDGVVTDGCDEARSGWKCLCWRKKSVGVDVGCWGLLLGSRVVVPSGSELEARGSGVKMDSALTAVRDCTRGRASLLDGVDDAGVMSKAVVLCRGISCVDVR